MDLYDTLKLWIKTPAVPLVTFAVDPQKTDRKLNPFPLEAHRHYLRVRLARMFLHYESTWFQHWFPALQSHIRFQFGDGTVEIPNVADAQRVKLQPGTGADLVIRNVPLTPTVPFHGGLIEISASLLAIKGENGLNKFIEVLGGFAEVLQTPQISAALAVAKPLASGLQVLLNSANDHLHLGYFNSFSAGELSDGYVVILRLPGADIDRGRLMVVQDELCEGDSLEPGRHRPFTRCDYMLLRVEIFDQRDDWEKLTHISKPWEEAQQALIEQGPEWEKLAATRFRIVLLRVVQAQELTRVDRIRVGNELRTQFEQLKQQFTFSGAVAGSMPSLKEIADSAASVESALLEREPTISEWLANT